VMLTVVAAIHLGVMSFIGLVAASYIPSTTAVHLLQPERFFLKPGYNLVSEPPG
jgi:hypothetical protein